MSLDTLALTNGGFLRRCQLLDLGYSDKQIAQLLHLRQLTRVRHGTYVPVSVWQSADEVTRHAIVVRSVLDKLGPAVVASHQSAAALHRFDLWGADLKAVHVTRRDGLRGRHEAGIVFHGGRIPEDEIVIVDGYPVTAPARAAVEASSVLSVEAAMIVASAALRDAITKPELFALIDGFDHWPGMRSARLAITLADGELETVGEVRSLFMMWRHRVPHPQMQVEIRSADGTPIGRLDFWWDRFRHAGEFDGLLKYGRLNPHRGHHAGQVLVDEKRREDALRGEGMGMTRWTWADLEPTRAAATAARLTRDIERSAKLFTRNAVHLPLR